MEKHTCKLCSRTFSNGRALGGHMRSHVTALSSSPQPQKPHEAAEAEEEEEEEGGEGGGGKEPSLSSSSSEEGGGREEDEEKYQGLYYGLRENPKKSFRLVDPEFSFAIDAGSVVQDRESETESSKNHIRRRSKRHRRSVESLPGHKPDPEPEPVSSVSNTSPEEDVARCLMMLSRDMWTRDCRKLFDDSEEENEQVPVEGDEEEEEAEEEKLRFCPRGRNRFQCGTCKKVFRSYQALGGHRASHKKIRPCAAAPATRFERADSVSRNAAGSVPDHRQIHECPVCFRVFKSGQALGGHKRSHLSSAAASVSASASASASPSPSPAPLAHNLLDLNLPAPIEDDDFSQVELSAVSDAEFFDTAK